MIQTTRRRGRQIAATAGAATALMAAASGCGSGGSTTAAPQSSNVANSSTVLRVGDQKATSAEALLKAAGLLDKLPFRVEWSTFTSGPPMLQAMGSGSLDLGDVGDAPPVFAAASGEKIAAVAAQKPVTAAAAILVPSGSPITSVAQLKGKTIAVAQGSSADYQLIAALARAGLTVHDVHLIYLQPADAEAAFAAHHVAAWAVWSPYIEQAETTNHAKVLADGTGLGGNYTFVVASQQSLADKDKSSEIKIYVKYLNQARTWANTHPAEWAKAWADGTGLPVSVMTQAAKDDVSTVVPIDSAVVSFEQQVADTFSKSGLIPKDIDFSSYIDTRFNSLATNPQASNKGGSS
jgi:sulfonate transport system substrate-binding protein